MCLAEMSQNEEHHGPYKYEEGNDKDQNLPFRYRYAPEETPITTIGLVEFQEDENKMCQ